MSSINIEVKIDETEIDKVAVGQPAVIKVDAFDQVELKGRGSPKTPLALGKSQTTGGLSTNINVQEAKEFKVVIELLEIPENVREGLRPITGEFDIEIKSGLKEGLEIITGPNKVLGEIADGDKVKRETKKPGEKKQ